VVVAVLVGAGSTLWLRSKPAARPTPAPASAPTTRPSAADTGPTNPAALKPFKGMFKVTRDGALIQDIDVAGQIYIDADNVTLRNFRVKGTLENKAAVHVARGRKGALIEDGEITAGAFWVAGLAADHFVARRLHIHHVHDGINLGDGAVVENCYIHDLGEGGGGHSDGIQAVLKVGPVVIRGNFIDASFVTSAINNVSTDWVVENNWLRGLHYTIYFNPEGTNPKVINNRFGGKGAPDRFRPAGAIWQRNVNEETGEPIP
jgi:hypothetical protein